MTFRSMFAAVAVAVAIPGCGPARLDVSSVVALEAGLAAEKGLSPQPKPQRVTVEWDAPNVIDVYVFDDKVFPDVNAAVPKGKEMAGRAGTKAGTLSVDVPANTGTKVVLVGAKKTDVKLHITNQK